MQPLCVRQSSFTFHDGRDYSASKILPQGTEEKERDSLLPDITHDRSSVGSLLVHKFCSPFRDCNWHRYLFLLVAWFSGHEVHCVEYHTALPDSLMYIIRRSLKSHFHEMYEVHWSLLCNLLYVALHGWVGLVDLQRFLPTPAILSFCVIL